MPSVEILTTQLDKAEWIKVVRELENRGHTVHTQYTPCDIGIILGGRFNNPLLFKKRILFYNSRQWGGLWDGMYSDVLREYYNKMVDVSFDALEGVVEKIVEEFNSYSVSSQNGVEYTR